MPFTTNRGTFPAMFPGNPFLEGIGFPLKPSIFTRGGMYQELVHLIASDFFQQLICQYSHIHLPSVCLLYQTPSRENKRRGRGAGEKEKVKVKKEKVRSTEPHSCASLSQCRTILPVTSGKIHNTVLSALLADGPRPASAREEHAQYGVGRLRRTVSASSQTDAASEPCCVFAIARSAGCPLSLGFRLITLL